MEIRGRIGGILARFFYLCFELIDRILRATLRIQGNSSGISFTLHSPNQDSAPIDERIKKIDSARENLLEGLKAIDELKVSAKENKKELENALEKLTHIENKKESVEQELNEIRNIANSDIGTFRKLAGVPGEPERRRERLVVFFSGVIASLIASGIIFGGVKAWKCISPLMP